MSPGPKKRVQQNKYRKDKAADSKREIPDPSKGNEDRDRNLASERKPHASDSEINEETAYSKKYNKRKIVNNWNRYEELPDAENEELRGVDFEVALTCSSGDVSQFRFEAEKEWEDESLQIDTSGFTSIDCSALAAALECIPLHKRLGISEDVFMPSMVEELCTDAIRKKKSYVPPKSITQNVLSHQSEPIFQSGLENSNNLGIIESLTSCLNIKDQSVVQNKEVGYLEKVTQKEEIDSELDFLLSLSSSNEKTSVTEKTVHNTQGDSASTSQQNSSVRSFVPSSTDINIDDWLDSVIED